MSRLFPVLCLLLAGTAGASELLEGVRARLTDAPLLRGQFEQTKTVTGFKKPLVSRGDFLLVRDEGVLWDTRLPFASELTITRRALTARDESGVTAFRLEASSEPSLAVVNQLMLALFSGDLAVLSTRFRVEGELVGPASWRLRLIPTDKGVAKVFREVVLEGDGFVRRVELSGASGDLSQIRFEKLVRAPLPTSAELGRLAK